MLNGVFEASDFSGITDTAESVIALALPIAVGVFSLLVGIKYAKKVLAKFGVRA